MPNIVLLKAAASLCENSVYFHFAFPLIAKIQFASVAFKLASKVFIEETDKNFDFITEIMFRFLGFGDFKVSIVIEN